MRDLRTASALCASLVAAGTLALSAAPAVARPTKAPSTAAFDARAGALCQGYFRTAQADDAPISEQLGADPSSATQAQVTAELLYTNATLSLGTEGQLAQLNAPAAERSQWSTGLASDRAGGLLTLQTAEVLAKLVALPSLADAAVSSYDSAYEQAEAGWNSTVKALGLTGCA